MQAVILAAGHGMRLVPLTLTQSKPMLQIANKPFVEWLYEAVRKVAKDIAFVVRPEQSDMIKHFEGRARFVYQKKAQGTGDALLQCKDAVSGSFLVINGDVLTTAEEIKRVAKSDGWCVSACPVDNPSEFGIFVSGNGHAKAVEEKPKTPKSNLANAGIYLLDDSVFERLKKCRKSRRSELELVDALSFPCRLVQLQKWVHVSFPWDLLDANKFILDEYGSQISNSAEIREGAFIEGPVAIGDNAVIGPNCFTRGHSSVGAGCKVGNAVEIKNSIVMENSFVSHLSYIGDSIIGRKSNVAAGTIFANLRLDQKPIGMKVNDIYVNSGRRKLGAIVGDGVQFGVNCTVMPGKRIWPNLLIPPCTIIKKDLQKQPQLTSWRRVLA